jgi:predicted AlkP superfamily pyrophosphatase or phosphodiesterase
MKLIRTAVSAAALLAWTCAAPAAQLAEEKHVIVIGVDGLSIDGVTHASVPRLRELMARSAWTLEARGVMPTLSSPNWASMITGAGPEQHGITSNGYLKRMLEIEPACRDAFGGFPNIFGALRTERPATRIAVFHDWPGFSDLLERNVADVVRHEHGPERTTAAAMEYWRANRPELMFVHLDNVDHAGHDSGWGSREYYNAVEEADGQIGAMLDMLRDSGGLASTYVLVTSDHGGKGHSHGRNSLAEILIPWIFSGPEVAPGRIRSAVYTYDTAATIAWIFELERPPCWIGRPVLAAFRGPLAPATHDTDAAGRSCATGIVAGGTR